MRKYESTKTNRRVDSEFNFSSKKKSNLQHIPNICTKSNTNTPKSPLQFKSNNPLLPLCSNSHVLRPNSKEIKVLDKLSRKDKQNENKGRRLTRKPNNNKEHLKFTQKKKINQKVKQLQQKFSKIKESIKKDPKQKNLTSLVTQYQVQNLVTTTAPLKFKEKNTKIQPPYYIKTLINAFTSEANPIHQLAKAHLTTSLQLLDYTQRIIKPSKVKPSKLPRVNKNTLVFDLDETLVHCNDSIEKPYDVLIDIQFPNGDVAKGGINIRPYAIECLKQLSQYYEIIVFTASHSCYANAVINHLDPQKEYISHRFFRESCHRTQEGMYIKDLRVIDRQLNNLLLIDNAAYSYCFQLQNGVPIVPFYNYYHDTQLVSLTQYLKQLANSTNLKLDHCKISKTDKFAKYTDPIQLIAGLYSDYLSG